MGGRALIVLDTHAWVWWVSDPGRLSEAAKEAIDAARTVGVCPISCWEIAMKVTKGRLHLDRDLGDWIHQALARPRVRTAELTAAVAVQAGSFAASEFHGDPADRLIAATAMALRAPLVTKDAQLRSFPALRTIW